MKAVFLDYATVDAGDLDPSPLQRCTDSLTFHPVTPDDELARRIGDHDVVLTNKRPMSDPLFEACPALRLICLSATGTDQVDLDAARRHGIAVTNIRDYCTGSVVQHVFALLLTLCRRLDGYRLLTARGGWQDSDGRLAPLPISDLADMTLGIVGYGTLGQAVARQAKSFGMSVLIAEGSEKGAAGRVELQELLARSDVVSLHRPADHSSHGMIGAAELARMRPGALLINTARGTLVDSSALADALRRGQLGGAGIDVLPEEPPREGDPLLDDDVPNLVLTPHVAWASRRARQLAIEEMAANIEAFAAGERRNRVD